MTRTNFERLQAMQDRMRQWAEFFGKPSATLLDLFLDRANQLPLIEGEGQVGLSARLARVVLEMTVWDFPKAWVDEAFDRHGSLAALIDIGQPITNEETLCTPHP